MDGVVDEVDDMEFVLERHSRPLQSPGGERNNLGKAQALWRKW